MCLLTHIIKTSMDPDLKDYCVKNRYSIIIIWPLVNFSEYHDIVSKACPYKKEAKVNNTFITFKLLKQ